MGVKGLGRWLRRTKVFPVKTVGKGGNIIKSLAEMMKVGFQGEGETLGEDRGLGSGDRWFTT